MTESPERVLGAMQSPRQVAPREELQAAHVGASRATPTTCSSSIGRRLIPTFDQIHEAMQRHRVERGEAERFIEGLLGLKLERAHYERGQAFVDGVVERAGIEGLNRLWESRRCCPHRTSSTRPGSGWPASTFPTHTDSLPVELRRPDVPATVNEGAPMKVGVLGAGVMGAGIAQVTATAGYETVCYDVDAGALERATRARHDRSLRVRARGRAGKLTREDADAALARLSFTAAFDDAADVDLVVEAVPEKLELKQQVFRDLDAAAPADTILASNTSGFPIGQLAAVTGRPELVIGWHWASPPAVMRLAEIVRAEGTSDATVQTVVERRDRVWQESGGDQRLPDGTWGFVANRVYCAMIQEANRCVDEGHRHPRAGRHADGRLLPLAGGPFGMVQGATPGWGQ